MTTETLFNGPRSVCHCGHTGDVRAEARHEGEPLADVPDHMGLQGHGACSIPGCKCEKFTWVEYTEEYLNSPAYAERLAKMGVGFRQPK